MIEFKKASLTDITHAARLALALWPEHTFAELEAELEELIHNEDAAVFLALQNNDPIGFAQCQLRRDYVEGTESSPVGYLEGIYVADIFRKTGIARSLLAACEQWAKHKGCFEFASDCELTNQESLNFHLAVGFEEANRIICFTKELGH